MCLTSLQPIKVKVLPVVYHLYSCFTLHRFYKANYLQIVQVKEVMEEVIETTAIHTFDITVLVTPGKGLFTDNRVDWCQLRDIRIIHELAILQ